MANKDFAIRWVNTPRSCSKDCEHWNRDKKVCRMAERKKPCPYLGRR